MSPQKPLPPSWSAIEAPDTRNNASAEIFIGFGAGGEVQRDAADRPIAEIEVAALIVAAEMADSEEGDVAIFDFVLVSGSGGEICADVGGAGVNARAIEAATAAGAGEVAEFVGGYSGRIALRTAGEWGRWHRSFELGWH